MRYLITFSYDGSKYKGYQKQPKEKTIQGELEKALKTINGHKKVCVYASGRTDAGVHAYNQKAHFDLDIKHITPEKLKEGLNSLLPDDIYIKNAEIVNDDFHARFNVKAKEYIYMINMGEYSPIEKDYIYQYNKKLDVVEMERALKYLEGTHNFKSFTKSDDEKDDYVRTIVQTNLIRNLKNVNKITLSFLGTGFMRYQVRNMIGTLIEIGEGKRKSEDIIDILAAEDRRKAGKTANPEGLYLKDVLY
ncbi:MAG: tRNA pseudouridine(38-40) synthase TruA [Bacilli bacterium]|nr:tRNA pseudouridine(38-40) synthase TruA [Bacilli bacterium]